MTIDLRLVAGWLLFALVLVYIPVGLSLFVNPTIDGARLQGSFVGYIWVYAEQAVIFGGLALVMLDKTGREAIGRTWAGLPLFAVMMLSLAWTTDTGATWSGLEDAIGVILVMPALMAWMGPRGGLRTIGLINAAMMVGSIVVVVLLPHRAVVQATDAVGVDHIGAWRGLFVHKNIMGSVAAAALLFLIPQGRGESRQWRMIWWGFRLAGLACLYFAHSSSSVLGFVAGLGAYWVIMSRRLNQPLPLAGVAVLGLLLIYGLSLSLDTLSAVLGRDATLTGRTEIWPIAIRLIQEKPFVGHGYAMVDVLFRPIGQEFAGQAINPHNGYLDVLFDIGAVGLAALLGYALYTLAKGYMIVRSSDDDDERSRAATYMAVVVSGLVMAMAEVSPFRVVGHGATFFYLAMAAMTQLRLPAREAASALHPAFGPALKIAGRASPAAVSTASVSHP